MTTQSESAHVDPTPAPNELPVVVTVRDIINAWEREPRKPGTLSSWERYLQARHGETEERIQLLIDRLNEAIGRAQALHTDNVNLSTSLAALTGVQQELDVMSVDYASLRFALHRFVLVSGQIAAITGLKPADVNLLPGEQNWTVVWNAGNVSLICTYSELALCADNVSMTLSLSREGLSNRQLGTILPFFGEEEAEPEGLETSETHAGAEAKVESAMGDPVDYFFNKYNCGQSTCPIHGKNSVGAKLKGKSSGMSALAKLLLGTVLDTPSGAGVEEVPIFPPSSSYFR